MNFSAAKVHFYCKLCLHLTENHSIILTFLDLARFDVVFIFNIIFLEKSKS
jgi:hypothetical protein